MPQINPNQLGAFQFPAQGPLAEQPQAFQMPQQPQNMASLYGLLAQHADNPAEVGMDYAQRMIAQQNANAQNSPYMQMLQIYGKINPHDFEADSIQAFHDHLMRTGEWKLDLLVRYDPYSSIEQKGLQEANNAALNAQARMGRYASLARRYEEAQRAGTIRSGWGGKVEEFIRKGLGVTDGISALRTEFNQVVNDAVLSQLPPGVASDTDIRIARGGWPESTDNPETIAALLRVQRAVEAYKYAQNVYRSRYISVNKGEVDFLDSWNDVKDMLVPQIMAEFDIPMADQIDAGYAEPFTGGSGPLAPPGYDPSTDAFDADTATREQLIEYLRRQQQGQ